MCKRQISTILILAILLGDCGLQCPPSSNIILHGHLRPMASAISGSAEGIKGSSAGSEEKRVVAVSAQKRAEEQDFAIFVMHNIFEGLIDTSVERQTLLLRSTTAAIFIELIIKNGLMGREYVKERLKDYIDILSSALDQEKDYPSHSYAAAAAIKIFIKAGLVPKKRYKEGVLRRISRLAKKSSQVDHSFYRPHAEFLKQLAEFKSRGSPGKDLYKLTDFYSSGAIAQAHKTIEVFLRQSSSDVHIPTSQELKLLLSIYRKALGGFDNILLTEAERIKICTALLRRKGISNYFRGNIFLYLNDVFSSNGVCIDEYEDDLAEEAATETKTFVDFAALYMLSAVVLKDPYVQLNLPKISQGAGINLKLKAYYMLYKETKSPKEVIEYLKARISECLEREKSLKGSPSVGFEVEIWKCIKKYPVNSAGFLCEALGMNLGNERTTRIEFSPQPARDWRDLAEMLDTMRALGMIPTQRDEAFSLHISVANPICNEDIFEKGASFITFAQVFLTCVDERLVQVIKSDFTYITDAVTGHHGHVDEVIEGHDIETDTYTHYGTGNIVSDRGLEFHKDISQSCHRRALRMVQLLHTALLAYVKEGKKNMREKLLAEAYEEFHQEFGRFIVAHGLDIFFPVNDKAATHIKQISSLMEIYRIRTPKVRKAMEGLVERHLERIEGIRDAATFKSEPALAKEQEGVNRILFSCESNIKLVYSHMAATLKEFGYDMGALSASGLSREGLDTGYPEDLPYPKGPNIAVLIDSVPGIELAGLIAREKNIKANFLYVIGDRNLFRDYSYSEKIFARYAVYIDGKGNLKAADFVDPLPVDAVVHGLIDPNPKVKNFFETKKTILLNPDEVMEFCENKADVSQMLIDSSLPTPAYTILEKGLSKADVKQTILRFIERNRTGYFVLKPIDGSEGEMVRMFTKDEIAGAVQHALAILESKRDVVLQKRIVSKSWYEDGERIDWNIRVLATWKGNAVVVTPEIMEVRYKKGLDSKPVNIAKGAKALSLEQFFERRGYSAKQRKEFVRRIQRLIRPAMKRLFSRIKRRNPKKEDWQLRPGLVGWDIIQSEGGKWYIIEANTGSVGGIQTLEGIYKDSPEKRGAAILPVVRYLAEAANFVKKEQRPVDLDIELEGIKLDASNEPGLLFDIGHLYLGPTESGSKKARAIFDRIVRLDEGSAEGWFNLGIALYNLGNYKDSEIAHRRGAELNPSADYLFELADALYAQKKYTQAIKVLRQVLRIDMGHKEARRLLRRISSILKIKKTLKARKATALETRQPGYKSQSPGTQVIILQQQALIAISQAA